MAAIETHVKSIRAEHRELVSPISTGAANTARVFASRTITSRQDALRRLSQRYTNGPAAASVPILTQFNMLEHVKASYAYHWDWKVDERPANQRSLHGGLHGDRGTNFPFDMAMRTLCDIKAKAASEGYDTILQTFADVMDVDRRAADWR